MKGLLKFLPIVGIVGGIHTACGSKEGQTGSQVQKSNLYGNHFMIQAANYKSLNDHSKSKPLFVYAFATDPALGIGKYSPPSCGGGGGGGASGPSGKGSWGGPGGPGGGKPGGGGKGGKPGGTGPGGGGPGGGAGSGGSGPGGGAGIDQFVGQLAAVPRAVAKMLIFSSSATAARYLADSSFQTKLRQAGVEWVGYNMEGDKTPPTEMCSVRGGNDPDDNSVSQFARAARAAGFKFIWGPIRNDLDRVSDAMVRGMCKAGMGGIALQEQNTLSAGVNARIQAVHATIGRYERLCGNDLYSAVQIMSRSCGADSCRAFAQGVLPKTDSIAIWATGSEISSLNSLILGLESVVH